MLSTEISGDSSTQTYLEQQHRLRGIIADFKSRRFVEKRSVPPSRRFRTGLNELYLDFRSKLAPSQYFDFLDWSQEMLTSQLSDLSHIPTRYDNLTGIFPKAPVLELQNELRWIAARIRSENEKITKFLVLKALVERATLETNYSGAVAALDALHEAYGATLWSIQLRLALDQQIGGIEQQKKYSAQVRSVYKQGLLGFITYHSSVRNEERTTIKKFSDDIDRRIANHVYYDDATKSYMRYRLKGELPTTGAQLADILRIEQSHGILDIYETFVAVLQELVRWNHRKDLQAVVLACIEDINTPDYRLEKIRLALNPAKITTLPQRSSLFIGRALLRLYS